MLREFVAILAAGTCLSAAAAVLPAKMAPDWVLLGETSPFTAEYFVDQSSIRRVSDRITYSERRDLVNPLPLPMSTGKLYSAETMRFEASCQKGAQRIISIAYLDRQDAVLKTRDFKSTKDMRVAPAGSVADVSIRYACARQ